MTAAMMPAGRSPHRLRHAAVTVFVLMLVITTASAFIRLTLGEPSTAVDWVRGIHRVAATAALLVIIGVAIFGWDRLRPRTAARIAMTALAGLALGLAFLGRFDARLPAVALANAIGGMTMVGLAWWLVLAVSGPRSSARQALGLGALLTAAGMVMVATGVLVPLGLGIGLINQLAGALLVTLGAAALYRSAS